MRKQNCSSFASFGFERWLVGLANVLQCGWVSLTDPKGRSGPAKTIFFLQYVSIKVNIFSVLFFNFQIMLSMYRCLFSLAHNDRGYGHFAVCGSVRCRETTKWMREQSRRNARQPANEHKSVCWTKFPSGRALISSICQYFIYLLSVSRCWKRNYQFL